MGHAAPDADADGGPDLGRLSTLPNEVLADVWAALPRAALAALMRTNRTAHALFLPRVYAHLHVDVSGQPLRWPLLSPQLAAHARTLEFELNPFRTSAPRGLLLPPLPNLHTVRVWLSHRGGGPMLIHGVTVYRSDPALTAPLANLKPKRLVVRNAPLLFDRVPDYIFPRAACELVVVVPCEMATVGASVKYEARGCSAQGLVNALPRLCPHLTVVFWTERGETWRPTPRPHDSRLEGAALPWINGTWVGRFLKRLAVVAHERVPELALTIVNAAALDPVAVLPAHEGGSVADECAAYFDAVYAGYAQYLGVEGREGVAEFVSMEEWFASGRWEGVMEPREVDRWLGAGVV
ncbi:PAB1 binding protein [Vanrija albida]|uniref:PAB1 binding protein n=1 Tax=Vanrija albida TaxID=181172 RepID=A0ABR3PUX5_9TREE